MIKSNNYAHPHLRDSPIAIINMDNVAPACGINSNIDDMLQWLQVWINKGTYNSKKLFSIYTYKTITNAKVMLSNNSDDAYGFGWYIGYENGKKILSHGGGLPGYKSFIIIIPDDSIGIVILTNKITYLNEELADVVTKYLETNKMNWKEADANIYGKNFHFFWKKMMWAQHTSSILLFQTFPFMKGNMRTKNMERLLLMKKMEKLFFHFYLLKNSSQAPYLM